MRFGTTLLLSQTLFCCAVSQTHAQSVIEPDRHIPLNTFRTAAQHEIDPAVALSGNKGLLLWKEGGLGSLLARDVHGATTIDGGQTWQAFDPLPRPPSRSSAPALVAGLGSEFHLLSRFPAALGLQELRLETADLSGGSLVWVRNQVLPISHSAITYPDIACHRPSGALHITYTHYDDIESGLASPCRVYYARSPDGGTTWSSPVILSGEGCDRSRVAVGPDGEVYVAWVDAVGERVQLRRSDDGGVSFGPVRDVAAIHDNRNTGVYQWWEPTFTPHPVYTDDMGVSNVPRLAVDHSAGPTRGRVHLAWTDHASGERGPTGTTRVEIEPNQTLETATLVSIGDDLYGSVPSADFGGDGDTWAFDGVEGQVIELRGTVDWDPDPEFVETKLQLVFCEEPGGGLVQLARTNTVKFVEVGEPPYRMRPMLVTLPRTGRYYLIVGGAGPYSIGYGVFLREWQVDAGSAARDHRDVVLVSSADRGDSWQPKVRVGDAPHRYDESLPEMVVDDLGRLHVTWTDRRNEPGCGARSDAYWAVSFDGGGSFTPGQRLSSGSTTWSSSNTINEFPGQRHALAVSGPWVHAFWSDHRDPLVPGADIWGTRMQVGGLVSSAVGRFVVEPQPTGVRIEWNITHSAGLLSVRVEREAAGSQGFAELAEQSGDGTREGVHVVVDATAEPGRAYRYRLALRYADGRLLHQGPLDVLMPQPDLALAWEPPIPNPSLGRTRLALSMPSGGSAEVEVFDIAGTRVRRVHSGALAAGRHAWEWPRADEPPAAPGIYLARVAAHGRQVTTRVVVTR